MAKLKITKAKTQEKENKESIVQDVVSKEVDSNEINEEVVDKTERQEASKGIDETEELEVTPDEDASNKEEAVEEKLENEIKEDVIELHKINSIAADDEEVLRMQGDDYVLDTSETAALIQQNEDVILYEIKNLYKEDGTIKKKKEIVLEPPSLSFSNAEGETVEILLSKNFTSMLQAELKIVNNAYHGIRKEKNKEEKKIKDIPKILRRIPEKFLNFKEWSLKSIFLCIAIVVVIVLIILGL